MGFVDYLYRILPLGEDTPREWPLFDDAERRCVGAGYEIQFSPDSRIVSVDLVLGADCIAEAVIDLSALEAMPRDVADFTLATMAISLLERAEATQ